MPPLAEWWRTHYVCPPDDIIHRSLQEPKGAIAINDTLLTMVIVANTRIIAMDSATSFKAVANHL